MRRVFHLQLEIDDVIFEHPRSNLEVLLAVETARLCKEMTDAVLAVWDDANPPSRMAAFAQALATSLADQRREADAR